MVRSEERRRVRDFRQCRQAFEEGHALQKGPEFGVLHIWEIRIDEGIGNAVWTKANDPNALRAELGGESSREPLYRRARDAKSSSQGNGHTGGRSRNRQDHA